MPKPSRPPSRISLRDIAVEAAVSVGSVSSVLNNRHLERRIPTETAEKIRATALKLGYLPNISARRLRSEDGAKNSVVLALVTSFDAPIPLLNHFVPALRRKAGLRLGDDGRGGSFSLLIEMFSGGRLREMPGLLTGDRFNAAILLNTTPEDDDFLRRTLLPYPVVLVNRVIPSYPSVIEHPSTGARAAELLVQAGRRRPVILYGTPLTQSTLNRVAQFRQRSADLLGHPACEIVAGHLSEESGYLAMQRALAGHEAPFCDGLYAVSDALALGAYRAIRERGLSVGKEVAVIGVGDYELGPYLDPPLSCVGVSHALLAEEASRLLLKQLSGEGASPEPLPLPMLEALRAST